MSDQSDLGFVSGQRVRDLGASEYLVQLIEQRLVRLIEFDGVVDPALMERAFHQMVARRPILQARVLAAAPGARPFLVIDDSARPAFSVRRRGGPEDWIGVFHEELNTPLGLDGDPLIRAQLLSSDEPGGELLVSCLHTACDGRSLFRFCRQLLSEYEALARGEAGDPSIARSGISPAVEDLLPAWATPERGKALVADHLERQAKLPTPMPWPSQREGSTDPTRTHVLPLDVPPDQVSAMRANARAHRTTMHGILGAAAILAIGDVLHPATDDEIVITTTVDIREGLRAPVPIDDMGIYAATIASRHSRVRETDPWDQAREFKAQVAGGIARNDHYAFVFVGAEFASSFTATAGAPLMTGSLGNLGMMELPSEGTALRPRVIRGGLNIHVSRWPFVSLNCIGINGCLAMTATYQNPEISDDRAREFVAAMSERMRGFARDDRGARMGAEGSSSRRKHS